jgi:hypothetical protein
MDWSHHHGGHGGLHDILLNNRISDAEQAVLAAISATGNSLTQSDLQNALTIIQNLNRVSSDLSTAVERNGSDGRQATERASADIRTELAQVDGRVNATIERNGAYVSSAVERNGGDVREQLSQAEGRISSATERNGSDTRSSVERNGGDTRESVALTEGRLTASIERNGSDTRFQVLNGQDQIHSTVEERSAEIRGLVNTNAMAQLLETERLKGCLSAQACHDTASLHRSIAETKFDLATEMAKCCCEQKELTMREAQATRMLIEKNTIDALRERLEDERRQNDRHHHNESIRMNVQTFMAQSAGNHGHRRHDGHDGGRD